MATLIGPDGKTIECHEPRLGCYFAVSHWTYEEALAYVTTGKYPVRLLNYIRGLNGPGHQGTEQPGS